MRLIQILFDDGLIPGLWPQGAPAADETGADSFSRAFVIGGIVLLLLPALAAVASLLGHSHLSAQLPSFRAFTR